jgi:hypothetical protein
MALKKTLLPHQLSGSVPLSTGAVSGSIVHANACAVATIIKVRFAPCLRQKGGKRIIWTGGIIALKKLRNVSFAHVSMCLARACLGNIRCSV